MLQVTALELFCPTYCLMAVNTPSCTRSVLSNTQRRTMHKWRRRCSRLCLESRNSTSSYVYGRLFTLVSLVTDHKPLTTILGLKTGVQLLAAAKMKRWALLLSVNNYRIEFRPTNAHTNADGMSCLPYHILRWQQCMPSDASSTLPRSR